MLHAHSVKSLGSLKRSATGAVFAGKAGAVSSNHGAAAFSDSLFTDDGHRSMCNAVDTVISLSLSSGLRTSPRRHTGDPFRVQ